MAEIDRKASSTGGGGGNVVVTNTAANPVIIRPLDCTDQIDVCDRVNRLLGDICFAGSAIDPRAIRALAFLTDKVDVSGSSITTTISGTPTVDVTDRAGRLIGIIYGSQNQQLLQRALTFDLQTQLRTNGTEYDARDRNWDLNFATDQVDTSGSNVNATISGTPNVTTVPGSVTTMDDAFMAFRLMMSYLDDLSMTIDPLSGRVRQKLESIDAGVTLPTVTTVTTVSTVTSVTNIAQIGGTPTGPADSFIPDEMDIAWSNCIGSHII